MIFAFSRPDHPGDKAKREALEDVYAHQYQRVNWDSGNIRSARRRLSATVGRSRKGTAAHNRCTGSKPEFLSVTLLPGRGMNMLQVTAAIPGKGEIPLLHSPSVQEAANQLTGTGKDQLGNGSFGFGGAFLIPYPNRIIGERSSDGKSVITQWRGHTLTLPANFPSKNPGGPVVAIHGLITQSKVEDLQTQTTADGQTVTGVIHAGNFGGHWLSDTDLTLNIALTGDAV